MLKRKKSITLKILGKNELQEMIKEDGNRTNMSILQNVYLVNEDELISLID